MKRRRYSFFDIIKHVIWLIRTKLISINLKLICFPTDIRGRKNIDWGKNVSIGVGCRLEAFQNDFRKHTLIFGYGVQLNDYVHIVSMESVQIGNNVLMASHIFISDNSHGSYVGDSNDSSPLIPPMERNYPTNPISIGDNTWICEGVMIMPGAKIGKGCIIGAHSIVRGMIPDYSIAVGNPAKVVKKFNFKTNLWERI